MTYRLGQRVLILSPEGNWMPGVITSVQTSPSDTYWAKPDEYPTAVPRVEAELKVPEGVSSED